MDYLFKLWYKDAAAADKTFHERYAAESSVHTGLYIRPMNFAKQFELFYVPTTEMMLKIESVEANDRLLAAFEKGFSAVTKKAFLIDLITEELFSSNDIEGVASNRQDIAHSTHQIIQGDVPVSLRMQSMILSYLKLHGGEVAPPEHVEDIRRLYDAITEGEIRPEDMPDGVLFTKDGSEVHHAVAGKLLHKGVAPEEQVVAHLMQLLAFMNASAVPHLIRVAIGHYYFAYIHPFYDGNGRTGRYISSLYLSRQYSNYTAYALARGCRLCKKKYMDLFDRTNKFNAYGEMNFAIESFLDILLCGQEEMIESLMERLALLEHATACADQNSDLATDGALAREILMIFSQYYYFSPRQPALTRDEVLEEWKQQASEGRHVSVRKMNRTLKELADNGYLVVTKRRPLQYQLNGDVIYKNC